MTDRDTIIVNRTWIRPRCYGCGFTFVTRADLNRHLAPEGPHGVIRPASVRPWVAIGQALNPDRD
jgi:hypothetical protein